MRYRIATERRGDQEIFLLHDDTTGAAAAVLPSHGFNLFDLRLPAAGEPRPMVSAADDFAENPRDGAGNGTPILFPFPNRVGQATFAFQGRTYSLPANNGPNAIHGFAVDAPWQVVEHKADANAASIIGRYQISQNSPQMLSHWPADAAIEVRYALAGRRLTMTITVSNPTATDLPYGFGIHPYFRLPFPPGGDPGPDSSDHPRLEVLGAQGLPPNRRDPPGGRPARFPGWTAHARAEARRCSDGPGVPKAGAPAGSLMRPRTPNSASVSTAPSANWLSTRLLTVPGHRAGALHPDHRRDQPPTPRQSTPALRVLGHGGQDSLPSPWRRWDESSDHLQECHGSDWAIDPATTAWLRGHVETMMHERYFMLLDAM